ncbi:MAG: hypothetical protein M1348_02275 [Candidatus Parvarchaeota archaeon]|nr:hypothetical protein [Candidatus Parvarchaeota archaeon]MCL5101413.1 hypothetical protein [Candidatus Parvarchaeota archaeon]
MLNEEDIKNLESLVAKEDMSLSDLELIKLTKLVSGITVVQSEDRFDWNSQTGDYYHILSTRDFDKYGTTSLDQFLDINTVDITKLGKSYRTYVIKGALSPEIGYGKPDLGALNLQINNGAVNIDLSKYSIANSRRVLEFYGYTDQGARMANWAISNVFNQKATVAYLDGPQKMAVVYRTTYSGREEQASRLYLCTDDSSILLDTDKNLRLALFMQALEKFHDSGLREASSRTVNVSKRIRAEELHGYA